MFCSTRGAAGFTFQHCLFRGLAEDGGMFMPQTIPSVTRDMLLAWRDLSFPDLAAEVLSLFISEAEIPRAELSSVLHSSFTYVVLQWCYALPCNYSSAFAERSWRRMSSPS
jgi:threonine synthase